MQPVDGSGGTVQGLMEMASATDGVSLLRHALLEEFAGRVAVVSAFGAESAVLLSIVADIDRHAPVLFLETGKHFPETLAYRERLVSYLGLTDVRDILPAPAALAEQDPDGVLWHFDPDACCALRKVAPLERALAGFDAWVTGRKRHQATTRTTLPFVEQEGRRLKFNPLADWTPARITAEMERRGLPRHPLVARGYPSIGCAVCTRAVGESEHERAGRWAGLAKTECGIHRSVPASAVA